MTILEYFITYIVISLVFGFIYMRKDNQYGMFEEQYIFLGFYTLFFGVLWPILIPMWCFGFLLSTIAKRFESK